MRIYEAARSVPQNALKPFKKGKLELTDINPMWRINKLTELFGVCGVGWYFDVVSERSEVIDESTTMAIVDIKLYIKVDGEWSKPIYGTGGNVLKSKVKDYISVSDEGYKMALTDAISVACKSLGFGADVYWSADKTKYTKDYVDEPVEQPPVCCRCGNEVNGVTFKGKQYTPAEIAEQSRQKYGDVHCWACMGELKKNG